MNEPLISLSKFGAYALWGATGALLLVGWGIYLGGLVDIAIMLATSACVTGLGATTLTIRCFARNVAGLVRIAGGMSGDGDGDGGGGGRPGGVRSIRE